MTNEEALNILYKGIAPNPTANNECIELCKKALEKQIPKRTKIKDSGTAETFAYNKEGTPILQFTTKTAKILCPRCRCENPTHPYCSECGQKIEGILL